MTFLNRQIVTYQGVRIAYGRRTYTGKRGEARVCHAYTAEFCQDGRRSIVPLETQDLDQARDRAMDLARHVAQGVFAPHSSATIADLAKQYLTYQKGMGRARTTLVKYEYVLTTFVAWADRHFRGPARKFTEADFWRWHTSVRDAYGAKSAYDRAVLVKQLFKWAVNKVRRLAINPVVGATLSKPPPNEQPVFQPAQVAAVLRCADDHYGPIFTLMAYAGLRFGEVRELRWDCVHLDPGSAHLVIRDGGTMGQTKTGTVRRIPIHPELLPVLKRLAAGRIAADGRVFHSRPCCRRPDGLALLNEQTVLNALKAVCARAGLHQPREYKLHSFRHTFASMLARSKTPIQYAQNLMGHKDSGILRIYYHVYDEVAAEAIASIRFDEPAAPAAGRGAA